MLLFLFGGGGGGGGGVNAQRFNVTSMFSHHDGQLFYQAVPGQAPHPQQKKTKLPVLLTTEMLESEKRGGSMKECGNIGA